MVYVATILAFVIFAGFLPAYYHAFFISPSWINQFHGLCMAAWCLLFILQSWLVRRHLNFHRFFGKLSLVLVLLINSSVIWILVTPPPSSKNIFLHFIIAHFLTLAVLFTFDLSYGLAVYYRKKRNLHAGYIIIANIILLLPTVIRIQSYWFPSSVQIIDPTHTGFIVSDLCILGLIVYQKRLGGYALYRSPYRIVLTLILFIQFLQLSSVQFFIRSFFSHMGLIR